MDEEAGQDIVGQLRFTPQELQQAESLEFLLDEKLSILRIQLRDVMRFR